MFSESVGLILKAHDRRFKFSNLIFFCPVFILLSVFAWVGDSCLLCWLIGTRAEKLLEGGCALVLWRNVLKHLSDNCELSSLWREFVLSHEPAMGLHLRLTGNRHTCSKWESGVERSPLEGKSHIFNNSSNTYGLFISSLQFIFSEIHHLITLNRCLVHMPLRTECSLMFLFTQPPLMGPGWQLVLEPHIIQVDPPLGFSGKTEK